MTLWKSDTCNCMIEFDDNLKIKTIIKQCKSHIHTVGSNFINCQSQKHNSDVNKSVLLSSIPTKTELNDLSVVKEINFKD